MSSQARSDHGILASDYLSDDEDRDPSRRMSTSPSPYDGDADGDESILSRSSIRQQHSPHRSSAAFTSVSSIPGSLPYNSDIPPYTPLKGPRHVFRSPAEVRAMQMASPIPFSRSRAGSAMSTSASARGTPGSTSRRSGSILHRLRHPDDVRSSPSQHGSNASGRDTPRSPTQRGPLVLLHVTVLPCPELLYSLESLKELAPPFVLDNWHLLQEQLSETILTRGILIPHPGEEFDLLEEGLLETLGLWAPRLGSCGHFYTRGEESDESYCADSGDDSGVSDLEPSGRLSKASRDEDRARPSTSKGDEDVCQECAHAMRIPGKGIGCGNTRWDVKIYAANGLMRAGAWAACWKEMERVDVEIGPWISGEVRRALDMRLEKEIDQQREQQEELDKLRLDVEVLTKLKDQSDQARLKADEGQLRATEETTRAEEERLKMVDEIAALRKQIEAINAGLPQPSERSSAYERAASSTGFTPKKNRTGPYSDHVDSKPASAQVPASLIAPERSPAEDIPLSTLIRNYVILMAQDRRNISMAILSILVIVLSIRLNLKAQVSEVGLSAAPYGEGTPADTSLQPSAIEGHDSLSAMPQSTLIASVLAAIDPESKFLVSSASEGSQRQETVIDSEAAQKTEL